MTRSSRTQAGGHAGADTKAGELTQLAQQAAHDLRSPLNVLTNVVQLFELKYKTALGAEGEELLHMMDTATREARRLVDDLLLYAHARLEPVTGVGTSGDEAFVACLRPLTPAIEETGAQVSARPGLPTVRIGLPALTTVLGHLIRNGIVYRRPGSPPIVQVSADGTGEVWTFHVRDNGVGVPPELLEEIFEPLRKLHPPGVRGSGLGLAVARAIVERHGGRMWAESAPGQGTTVSFTLPGA